LSKREPLAARIIDNLWLWAIVALAIMFIYAAWALIEALVMHSPKAPPVPA
jgi:hypothetical protein